MVVFIIKSPFVLFGRQSVTLNIGCSHNRDNRPSEQSAKCNIGQALLTITVAILLMTNNLNYSEHLPNRSCKHWNFIDMQIVL